MGKFKEAKYYKKLPEKYVHCQLCPHHCIIDNGEIGKCKVRMNVVGNLKSMNYGKPYYIRYKKMEEFPLYHFLPDSKALVVGGIGDNLNIPWDNHETKGKEISEVASINQTPLQIIKHAEKINVKTIVYGEGEPVVNYEHVFDTAENSRRLKHVLITKGFIEDLPIRALIKKIDCVLIDIKSMNESFHDSINSKLDSILRTMKILYDNDVWVEVKMNMVPGIHEDLYDIKRLCSWILNNLDANVPLHLISQGISEDILEHAKKIATSNGMNYVYTHNVEKSEKTTYCPNCKKALIERGYNYNEHNVDSNLVGGKCSCGKEIAGVWE